MKPLPTVTYLEDSEFEVIVTADGGYMNGKVIELKKLSTRSLRRTAAPENVVVVRHTGKEVAMEARSRLLVSTTWMSDAARPDLPALRGPEEMDAEDPALYPLYIRDDGETEGDSGTHTGATRSAVVRQHSKMCSTSRKRTGGGAPQIPGGSPAIPISSTPPSFAGGDTR